MLLEVTCAYISHLVHVRWEITPKVSWDGQQKIMKLVSEAWGGDYNFLCTLHQCDFNGSSSETILPQKSTGEALQVVNPGRNHLTELLLLQENSI